MSDSNRKPIPLDDALKKMLAKPSATIKKDGNPTPKAKKKESPK